MKIYLILLFLLKMLGFVLLILLAVLLLILLIVLLTPIHYGLFGEKSEVLKGSFSISWFFRLLQVKGKIEESGIFKFQLRLFGKPFLGDGVKQKNESKKRSQKENKEKRKEEKRQKEEERKKEKRKKEESQVPSEGDTAISIRSRQTHGSELPNEGLPTASPPTASPPMADSLPKRVNMEDVLEQEPVKDFHLSDIEPEDLPDDFFTSEYEKKKGLFEYYSEFQSIHNKKGILKALVLLLKRLLRGILPKNFYLKGTVGTGDPASTGYLCGLLGVLKMKFGNQMDITADFKEMTLRELKISIKGKIVPGYFAYAVLRFLFTKPVWRTVKLYWKGKR